MALVEQWRRIEAGLPEDWADARLELTIGDEARSDRAAVLLAPLNPGRFGKRIRFYTARSGAGPAPQAVARLLARLDENGIPGDVRILRVLSDTDPVATQGPVWYVGGKAV